MDDAIRYMNQAWRKLIAHEARRYNKRAMKSDRVLIDARKATVPDAKHTIAIERGGLLEQAVRRLRERKSGGNR